MSEDKVDDLLTINIDGIECKVAPGTMLIEVADANHIDIPRFCYHKKLSVAANCRMCMVEVEKAPKPLPACATPVMDGMKVFTKSEVARDAQKGTMEFLLINHPLDCPICDQGGECELQDVAMGYGEGISQYTEIKRVVKDKDIGPLIATEMTRCIHCTRCVRFGEEIANMRELGATGRGENLEIGTFIEKSVDSELSGNVIDLCPVGALTAKPSRFSARAWEVIANATISPHDGTGSNLTVHTHNGEVIRVVPTDNEAINETWLSDRDRFSYSGIESPDRLAHPMVKENDGWVSVDWEEILTLTQGKLNHADAADTTALISPNATLEEMYLLQKYMRGMGVNSIDHRLRQSDFSDQAEMPLFPWLGTTIAELESQQAVLLVGSDIRLDQPLISNRLRKAVAGGGCVMVINSCDYQMNFDVSDKVIATPQGMLASLASVAAAVLSQQSVTLPDSLRNYVSDSEQSQAMAKHLLEADRAMVLIGQQVQSMPNASAFRALASLIEKHSNITFGFIPDAANSSGGWIAGAVPHRGPAGQSVDTGHNAADTLGHARGSYFLWGIEPEFDCVDPSAVLRTLSAAATVIVATAYVTDTMKQYADIILPISTSYETSGTFVNAEGNWQSFRAVAKTPGEARPGWKVLRVLANLAELEGFDYTSSEQVREDCKQDVSAIEGFSNQIELLSDYPDCPVPDGEALLYRSSSLNCYQTDALVRRSHSLQSTSLAANDCVVMNADDAKNMGLVDGETVEVLQGNNSVFTALRTDDSVAVGCVDIQMGSKLAADLGPAFGDITVRKS